MKKIIAAAFLFLTQVNYAQESKALDYTNIDSKEKAIQLYQEKSLEKIYLMALDFGGDDSEVNIVYVPLTAKEQKERFDEKLVTWLMAGKELGLKVEPQYKGKSFIPSKLIMKVTGEENLTEVIEIW
jgi:hypothetical protein